mmetsp:Transcript_62725/g.141637  ORF Transcript_62725/g.141637 Transcript_62725/m.141637 type:complete len:392 (-) Transcript_62725:117-1292(-)
MNFYVVTAFYLVVGGLGVGIFLWGKPDGNSLFDRLYRIVCVHFPSALKKLLERCCGKRAPAFLDWLWNYLCYRSNPVVQIFYLAVVVGGFTTYVAHGFPHLPNRFVGSFHKYTGLSVFCSCLGVWWRACSTDPGTVTQDNVDDLIEVYKWDQQIFTSAVCKTCDTQKPARSKHCSLCNICVAKFDHHCIWINNCVGVGNHKWFLWFLFMHLVLCFYGAGLGTVILYDVILQKDLLNAVFVDPVTREKHKASYLIIAQYMLATEGLLIFVSVLCAIMGLVLFGFYLWHLSLVYTGMTTNELSKWNYLKWCLRQEGDEGKAKIKQLQNIYNQGCTKNFKEVFFPINVHKLPRQLKAEASLAAAASGGKAAGKREDGSAQRQEKRKGKDKAKRG